MTELKVPTLPLFLLSSSMLPVAFLFIKVRSRVPPICDSVGQEKHCFFFPPNGILLVPFSFEFLPLFSFPGDLVFLLPRLLFLPHLRSAPCMMPFPPSPFSSFFSRRVVWLSSKCSPFGSPLLFSKGLSFPVIDVYLAVVPRGINPPQWTLHYSRFPAFSSPYNLRLSITERRCFRAFQRNLGYFLPLSFKRTCWGSPHLIYSRETSFFRFATFFFSFRFLSASVN